MSDEDGLDSQSYNKNYKVLKDTADWLSKQDEPDIDQLVPRVEKAMRAYQICKDRLIKVQTTLGQYFQEDVPEALLQPTVMDRGEGHHVPHLTLMGSRRTFSSKKGIHDACAEDGKRGQRWRYSMSLSRSCSM